MDEQPELQMIETLFVPPAATEYRELWEALVAELPRISLDKLQALAAEGRAAEPAKAVEKLAYAGTMLKKGQPSFVYATAMANATCAVALVQEALPAPSSTLDMLLRRFREKLGEVSCNGNALKLYMVASKSYDRMVDGCIDVGSRVMCKSARFDFHRYLPHYADLVAHAQAMGSTEDPLPRGWLECTQQELAYVGALQAEYSEHMERIKQVQEQMAGKPVDA